MSDHTKTPWKVDQYLGSRNWTICVDAGDKGRGIDIADTVRASGKELGNAKFIVKSANYHKRLMESLLFCVEQIENEDPDKDCMDNIAADQARALLAEIEEGE